MTGDINTYGCKFQGRKGYKKQGMWLFWQIHTLFKNKTCSSSEYPENADCKTAHVLMMKHKVSNVQVGGPLKAWSLYDAVAKSGGL